MGSGRLVAIAVLACTTGAASAQDVNPDPAAARLVTSDIELFWSVLERSPDAQLGEALQRDYIDAGSVGVRDFVPYRILGGEELAAMIRRRPERYGPDVRERARRVQEFEKVIRAGFFALEYLYPAAQFPDTYFVIGRLNSGGTASSNGMLIGVEMYADSDEAMEKMPWTVVHEAIHYQQNYGPIGTLLGQSINEGAADFVAELATGHHSNEDLHRFGNAREAEVWRRFSAVMHEPPGNEGPAAGWLYGGSPFEDGPPDLGYYVGYKICEAYYRRADDPRQAVHDMLNIVDFDRFLEESGYGEAFTKG